MSALTSCYYVEVACFRDSVSGKLCMFIPSAVFSRSSQKRDRYCI